MDKVLLIIAGLYLLSLRKKEVKGSPPNTGATYRGMKNNNPGNIRISNNQWQGKIPIAQNTDGSFEQFQTMFYGVRAALVNMRSHYNRGKNTVYKLVTTWAPFSDNPTDAVLNYVAKVSKDAGINSNTVFPFNQSTVSKIAMAMFQVENAGESPDIQTIKNAYNAI